MTKYFIGQLEIRNGECEYVQIYKYSTTGKAYRYLNGVAKTFYGRPDERQGYKSSYHYFNGGEVAVKAGSIQEITREVFDALTLISEAII